MHPLHRKEKKRVSGACQPSLTSLVGLWYLTEDRSWRDKEEVGTLWRPHWAAVWRPLP